MIKPSVKDDYICSVKKFMQHRDSPPLANVHSFGCQLNFSDGEKIKGQLLQMNFGFTESYDNADVIILNTCAVRESAEDRVFGNIGYIKHLKEQNPNMILALCGCMAGEQKVIDKIKKSYPYVDIVFGTSAINELPKLIFEVLNGKKHAFDTNEYQSSVAYDTEKLVRDSDFKASVPIMYGCNNFCTYCIVPYVRGRERSRPHEDIISEVQQLAKNGYKEIMLLGQNVNSYGSDIPDSISFSQLLRKLNDIDGNFIIRFMSSHPKDAGYELINTILECDKVAKHLHLPVQSGSNDILKRMNRSYTIEKYMDIINYTRSKNPDFSFGTDIIVGFPNETDEQFRETLGVLQKVKYDNLYSFIYSKRSGTKAADMDDSISPEEKSNRMSEMLSLQREISSQNFKRFIGRTMTVLADGKGKNGNGWLIGKSNEFIIVEFQAPDSLIGQFVKVKITQSRNWAVIGELIN